jgi:hypothetical protein
LKRSICDGACGTSLGELNVKRLLTASVTL